MKHQRSLENGFTGSEVQKSMMFKAVHKKLFKAAHDLSALGWRLSALALSPNSSPWRSVAPKERASRIWRTTLSCLLVPLPLVSKVSFFNCPDFPGCWLLVCCRLQVPNLRDLSWCLGFLKFKKSSQSFKTFKKHPLIHLGAICRWFIREKWHISIHFSRQTLLFSRPNATFFSPSATFFSPRFKQPYFFLATSPRSLTCWCMINHY